MLAAERRQRIKDIVFEEKSASVSKLAQVFSVTDETIRRDLKVLEREGHLTRTHGGAFIQDGTENNISYSIRFGAYQQNKRVIAKRCADLIQNGDTVLLDNSSTCYYIAQELSDKRITIVTNSVPIMDMLSKVENVHLIGIGGYFSLQDQGFCGVGAIQMLENFYVDKAFFSCRSVDIDAGITDSTERWALIRRLILKHSRESYLVADYTKFGRPSFVSVAKLSDLTGIITDYPLPAPWHEAAKDQGFTINDGANDTYADSLPLPDDELIG